MQLTCYVYPGWRPRIRAASARRDWMDASPESFAYRCLPLNIANAHGWELLSPCGFEATWNGGPGVEDVAVRADPGTPAHEAPVALFGQGTFTIHIPGLFRTSPGCNLWVGGPPNRAKDGLAPLGGVIETDWSPYTFTMNWRFTRPHQRVRFEQDEPVCFIFPLPRNLLDDVVPRIVPIEENPELKHRFEQWSRSRNRFQAQTATHPPASPGAKWQKFYYRGTEADGIPGGADHRAKLRLPEFAGSEAFLQPPASTPRAVASKATCPVAHATAKPPGTPSLPADELLATLERLRTLSPRHRAIPRTQAIPASEFLDRHYAANWPLLLSGEMDGWPALDRWTPDYLAAAAGVQRVDAPAGTADPPATLAAFIAQAGQPHAAGGALRLAADLAALPALADDLRGIDRLLAGRDRGRLWLEVAGSGVGPQQETANRLLLQIVGRRRVVLAAPGETGKLRAGSRHGPLGDLAAPNLAERLPELRGLRVHVVWLEPGETLFVPYGWWRQTATDAFSASVERGDFRWPDPG
jgi:hypothetical protein